MRQSVTDKTVCLPFFIKTVQEAAELWGISEKQVLKSCKANRIDGVIHLSRVWLIPKDTKNKKTLDGKKIKK